MTDSSQLPVKILKFIVVALGLAFVLVAVWRIFVLSSSPIPVTTGTIVAHPGTPIAPETINPNATVATQDPVLHATFMAEKYPEPGSPAFATRAAAVVPYQNSSAYTFQAGVWLAILGVLFVLFVVTSLMLRARLRKAKR
jgi:hypothetical protein